MTEISESPHMFFRKELRTFKTYIKDWRFVSLMYLPRKIKRAKPEVCPLCKGTGKVKLKENGEKEIPCPRCEGRRFI